MRGGTRFLLVGAICGLTWAAALRGWTDELTPGALYLRFTWTTLALVLLPGLVVGALLGWSAYVRSTGVRGSGWLVVSPVLLAAVLLDPGLRDGVVGDRTWDAVLSVVATALAVGYVLARPRWSTVRVGCAVVAVLGLLLVADKASLAAPVDTPRGAWVCLYGCLLALLLGLAATLPYPRVRRPLGSTGWITLGAVTGLAWSCALREFMAQVAGSDSGVEWGLTFGFILLPGAAIGALLGWAEALRRRGGRRVPRVLVFSPFLFAAVLFSDPLHLGELFEDGIGGGTVGVPLIAILGGHAVCGRGALWGRIVAGVLFLAGFTTWLLVATDVGGPEFSLATAHGLWVSTLYESLLVVFALAASVPQRAPHRVPVLVTGREDAWLTAG
jgi:hypothetical protein